MNTANIFSAGWARGHNTGRLMSYREASTLLPTLSADEIAIYLNGVEDGVHVDRARLPQ